MKYGHVAGGLLLARYPAPFGPDASVRFADMPQIHPAKMIDFPMNRSLPTFSDELIPGIVSLPGVVDPNVGYKTYIDIGTPPQTIACVIDIGRSDNLIQANSSTSCADANNGVCVDYGNVFMQGNSSTFSANLSFATVAGPECDAGAWCANEWGTDVVSLGSAKVYITGQTIGLSQYFSGGGGMIGLGFVAGEITGTAIENGKVSPTYDNLVASLKTQGHIQRAAFSIWTNTDGAVLVQFGGVDHSRYSGPFVKVPMVGYLNGPDGLYSLNSDYPPLNIQVMLHGLTLELEGTDAECPYNSSAGGLPRNTGYAASDRSLGQDSKGGNGTDNGTSISVGHRHCSGRVEYEFAAPASFQSVLTITFVPDSIMKSMVDALQLIHFPTVDLYIMSCTTQGTISFNFSGVIAKFALSDFMGPFYDERGNSTFADGTPMCFWPFGTQGTSGVVLGAQLLNRLYTVFDLDGFELAMALNTDPANSTGIGLSNSGQTVLPTVYVETIPSNTHKSTKDSQSSSMATNSSAKALSNATSTAFTTGFTTDGLYNGTLEVISTGIPQAMSALHYLSTRINSTVAVSYHGSLPSFKKQALRNSGTVLRPPFWSCAMFAVMAISLA